MNAFDQTILSFLNQFAHRSYIVDTAIRAGVDLDLLKGGVFMATLCWFWFAASPDRTRRRQVVVATLVAAFVAIVVGRALAAGLPFRIRPMQNPTLGFVEPYGAPPALFRGWSAFPSDHAMLFATLATGVWFLSARLGLALHSYAAVVIGMPRLYVGWHHPTDLLAGAALGILLGAAANAPSVRARLAALPLRWAEARPHVFYAFSFLVAIQIATMFDDARTVAKEGVALARYGVCRAAGRPNCDSETPGVSAPMPARAPPAGGDSQPRSAAR